MEGNFSLYPTSPLLIHVHSNFRDPVAVLKDAIHTLIINLLLRTIVDLVSSDNYLD